MRLLLLLVFGCLITQSDGWILGIFEGIFETALDALHGGVHLVEDVFTGLGELGINIAEATLGIFDAGVDMFGNAISSVVNIGGNIVGNVIDESVNLVCAVVGVVVPCRNVPGQGSVAPLPFQCRGKADIIFVVDASSSVGDVNFKKLLSFAANLAGSYLIGPANTRFGLVVFSKGYQKWFDLKDFSKPLDVIGAIVATPYTKGSTETDKALNSIITNRMFDKANGGRSDARDVVITLTDGRSDNPTATTNAANALKNKGITLFSVGVGTVWGSSKGELLNLASSDDFAFKVNSFDRLDHFLYQLGQKTCAAIGGKEVPVIVEPPIDENESVCDAQADIVFLVDSSGSIGPKNYLKLLNFAVDLVNEFKVGKNAVLFGSVVFSTEVQKWFDLKDNPSKSALRRALLKMPYLNATTNTHLALDLVRSEKMFGKSAGGRDGAQNIVILITDGKSDYPAKTVAAADKVKNQEDATIIALGIGKANRQELEDVASSSDDVLYVNNFDALQNVKDNVVNRACENSKKK